jgi:hypothetical protein
LFSCFWPESASAESCSFFSCPFPFLSLVALLMYLIWNLLGDF